MKKQENLFRLIKSLTRTEKRYFKLQFASSGRHKNYLELFDYIDSQDTYDEKRLKHDFSGRSFLTQLHVAKNYLINLILKCLRSYHSGLSNDARLNSLIHEIEILYAKDLFNLCRDRIAKATKLAEEYEKFNYLHILSGWERKLLLKVEGSFAAQVRINEVLAHESRLLQALLEQNQLWTLALNVFDYLDSQSDNKDNTSNALMSQNVMQNAEGLSSIHARVLHYYILQTFHYFSGRPNEANAAVDSAIHLLEQNPKRISEDPTSYITALNNKIGVLLNVKDYELIRTTLAKIRAVPEKYQLSKNSAETIKFLLQTYNVELEMYRDTRDTVSGIRLIEKVKSFLRDLDWIPDEYRLLFHYQFAYLFFLEQDYDQALHWLNRIMMSMSAGGREDILAYAQLLNLIIHYELSNWIVLRYAVDSCRRFLGKKRTLYSYERVLLRFFSKLSTVHPEKHGRMFEKIYTDLFSGSDYEITANTLDYLDFKSWIRQKIAQD